ncbi:TPA: glycosyltransferase family 2 protein [Enterobacter hormaechei]|nr:glycosyltransferase family 2 protein [Enterobacter hormaechei]
MIVIPMAGLSSRFLNAGYKKPKYMLEAHGKTLFSHSVESFSSYFECEKFLFIIRDVYNTDIFVEHQAKQLGILDFEIVTLTEETRGQAETVALGLEKLRDKSNLNDDCSITIFNIDTFRPNFKYPDLTILGDGYLEVFIGSGDNWSFAKPKIEGSTIVIKTAEKNPISDLCCTGLYYFKSLAQYLDAYYDYFNKPESDWEKGELYVAPLYNNLISKSKEVHYNLISRESVVFCGIPEEYEDFLKEKSFRNDTSEDFS